MDFRTMLKKKKYAKNVNDEGDPDWGKLKKVDRPDGSDSDPDKQVNNPLFLRHYLIFNIILYICFRCKLREMAESSIYTLSFDEFWIRENHRKSRAKMVTGKNSSNHNSTFFGYILTGGKKAFSLIRRSGFLAWIKASQAFATGKYYCHKFLGFYGIELAQWGQALYEVKFLFLKQGDSTKSFLKYRSKYLFEA